MSNRNEILLAARREAHGDLPVTTLLSDAMACETRFGMVVEMIESLRRFPQSAIVKERGGALLVEYQGHEFDHDLPDDQIPDWSTTEL